jgi:hypothetical protein
LEKDGGVTKDRVKLDIEALYLYSS